MDELITKLVVMKSGRKVHVAFKGSVQTFCGKRYARSITSISERSECCQQCGLSMDLPVSVLAERYSLKLIP